MDNPRPEKVAVVDEVRTRLASADAAILTEYRGMTVAEMAALRKALAAVGGDYKVYKNTLVKLAVDGSSHEPLQPLLVGPTAIAFVSGDVTAVAKALRDFARTTPTLVVKGGMLDTGLLSATDLASLADLPSREVLLSRIAGGLAAPMQQMAGLLQALPRSLAYGLKALLDERSQGTEVDQPTVDQVSADQPAAEAGITAEAGTPEEPAIEAGSSPAEESATGSDPEPSDAPDGSEA
jgi:large subunit ribosomal protein L10